jgi:hypothetical protein
MRFIALFAIVFTILTLPSIVNAQVVINEIQITGGKGLTAQDFVELYNTSDEAVNLKGHRLVKRTKNGASDTSLKSWTKDTIIPAGGYYLWASKKDPDWPLVVKADTSTTQTLASDNAVALRNGPSDTGEIIDSVGWGAAANDLVEGTAFANNPGGGESIARTNGVDTDDNNTDFSLQATPTPQHLGSIPAPESTSNVADEEEEQIEQTGGGTSPPPLPAPAPKAKIIINEIFPNPYGSDAVEFIELTNVGNAAENLEGWSVANRAGQTYTLQKHILRPGEFFVLRRGESRLVLQNTSDTVRLIAPEKTRASESIAYTKAPDGQARIRIGEKTWSWSISPTPGRANVEADFYKPPVAVLTVPTTGTTGAILMFDATDSYDPQGWKITTLWDFGDEIGTSTNPFAPYLYTTPGSYTVTLAVESAEGYRTEKTVKVKISGDSLDDPEPVSEDEASLIRDITKGIIGHDVLNKNWHSEY